MTSHTVSFARESRAHPSTLSGWGLVTLLIGPFLANLDLFITNVALPSLRADLGASPAALQFVVAGYALAYALLLVPGGRLGDHFGRRRVFAIGLALFTLASLGAGLAPTVEGLIAARIVQGGAAALLAPQALATVQSVLTGRARAVAISRYAVAGGLAAVAGQLVGGLLIQADVLGLGWRPVFLVNVPFGLVALALLRRTVPETRAPAAAGLDPLGTTLLGVVLVGLLVPLTLGPAAGWPWWSVALLLLVAPTVAALAFWELREERRGRAALLPPSLLRTRSMRRGLPVVLVFFIAFSGFLFAFALVSQTVLGLGPLLSGLAITPTTVVYVATSFAVPRLLRRFGRGVLVAGGLLQAVGVAGLAVAVVVAPADPPLGVVLVALVMTGCGQALSVGALFRIVLADVPAAQGGVGSGMMVATQQAALALGVALLGSLLGSLLPVDAVLAVGVLGGVLVVMQVGVAASSAVLPRMRE
ncbi:MFS transporter [Herbiconiux sp. KACC 21604]|uniref:MFS transporter n=1 Tax=unclassified Herbiconiux TaxID=2618217 RepID=UPI001491A161|nr:MFS transporter [Herbiconiux sp. SALV-R1]QJU55709.1 MFS transporter [Herbiconiux sp. SALV-R1]WPO86915.1 MFS transporter [Herbiconiux sp. KACC 21604]